jgi:hypothetical protein
LKDQKEIKLIFTKLIQTLSFLYEELELLEFFENVKQIYQDCLTLDEMTNILSGLPYMQMQTKIDSTLLEI